MLQRQSHLSVWYDHVANPPGDYTKVHGKHEAEVMIAIMASLKADHACQVWWPLRWGCHTGG